MGKLRKCSTPGCKELTELDAEIIIKGKHRHHCNRCAMMIMIKEGTVILKHFKMFNKQPSDNLLNDTAVFYKALYEEYDIIPDVVAAKIHNS
jgi:hypothetical protein